MIGPISILQYNTITRTSIIIIKKTHRKNTNSHTDGFKGNTHKKNQNKLHTNKVLKFYFSYILLSAFVRFFDLYTACVVVDLSYFWSLVLFILY